MTLPRNWPEMLLVALVCLFIGYGTGAVLIERKRMVTLERTLTSQWSDAASLTLSPPRCAHVYLEPHMNGVSVRLRVYHGRKQPLFYEHGEFDVQKTPAAAARKWGALRWTKKGLHVGTEANATLFLPHTQMTPSQP